MRGAEHRRRQPSRQGWARRTILWRGSWWWAFDDRFSAGPPGRPLIPPRSRALDRTVKGMCPPPALFTTVHTTRQKSFKTAVMPMARFVLLICEVGMGLALFDELERFFSRPHWHLSVKLQAPKKSTDGSYFFSPLQAFPEPLPCLFESHASHSQHGFQDNQSTN